MQLVVVGEAHEPAPPPGGAHLGTATPGGAHLGTATPGGAHLGTATPGGAPRSPDSAPRLPAGLAEAWARPSLDLGQS